MPKKIFFESAVHQFVSAGQTILKKFARENKSSEGDWRRFLESMNFTYLKKRGFFEVSWEYPKKGSVEVDYSGATFYHRGDADKFVERLKEKNLLFTSDKIQKENEQLFTEKILSVAKEAGIKSS